MLAALTGAAGSQPISIPGDGAKVSLASSSIVGVGGFGAFVTGDRAGLYLTDGSTIRNAESDSLHILGNEAVVLVQDSSILNSGVNGTPVSTFERRRNEP